VSNASARTYEPKSIKDTCEFYEKEISVSVDFIMMMDEIQKMEHKKEEPNYDKLNKYAEQELNIEKVLMNQTKIYHYLDCREELGR
tara:strand:+ start:528 stop:785 length:258 start_codon:yes stop_codon:yes gene_type:complete